MNKFIMVMFLPIILISCKKYNNIGEIHELYVIISKDSSYYEFYFDNKRQFFKDPYSRQEENNINDSIIFNEFLSKMESNKTPEDDSATIITYINKELYKKIDVLRIGKIDNICYNLSNNEYINYISFINESFVRCIDFMGYELIGDSLYKKTESDLLFEMCDTLKVLNYN